MLKYGLSLGRRFVSWVLVIVKTLNSSEKRMVSLDEFATLLSSYFFSPSMTCRPKLEDISHNSALEAAGFLSLFLSSKSETKESAEKSFFTR